MTTAPDGTVADAADAYFQGSHNCAMAVLRAVTDAYGFGDPECIPAIAVAMGGGIGHTGGVCGAVSGAAMALGLAVERYVPGDMQARKDRAYALARDFAAAFEQEFDSTDCRDILGFSWLEAGAADRFRRENAKAEKCAPAVRWAAAEASRLVRVLRDEAAG